MFSIFIKLKKSLKRKILNVDNLMLFIFFSTFIILSKEAFALTGCGDDANPALKTICDIIMFLQGRIGRALVMFMVMMMAWEFVGGQLKWQPLLTMAIGIGLFYAPKTFALFLLPEYIQGITGEGYDESVKYTPDEIISCACPNLR